MLSGYQGSERLLQIFSIILFRYLILASLAYLVFYVIRRRAIFFRKIQRSLPLFNDYKREVLYSFSTAVIFSVMGYLFFFGPLSGYTHVYREISRFGWGYFTFSIL